MYLWLSPGSLEFSWSPFFKIGFIRQLFVFSIINISVTVISLIVTIFLYRIKLKPIAASAKVEKYQGKDNIILEIGTSMESLSVQNPYKSKLTFAQISDTEAKNDLIKNTDLDNVSSMSMQFSDTNTNQIFTFDEKPNIEPSSFTNTPKTTSKTPQSVRKNFLSTKQAHIQQKATRTFLIMLCVFVATYLPTAVTMIFMNICTTCNCLAVHIMRDVSIISILSSSVFRPLNFILTLKHLRETILQIFKKNKRQDGTLTSDVSGSKNTSSKWAIR